MFDHPKHAATGKKPWLDPLAMICLGALAFVAIFATLPAKAQSTADFMVKYDQVRLLRLDIPAADVIVGNPSIADVAVQSGQLLAITGKTFGVTNLIVLNTAGQVITQRRIIVRGDDRRIVSLSRGKQRESYNCAPRCQTILTIGDDKDFYGRVSSSSQEKLKISDTSAQSTGAGE